MINFSNKGKPAVDETQQGSVKIRTGINSNNQSFMVKFWASRKNFATLATFIIIIGALAFYFVGLKTNSKVYYVYLDMESYTLQGGIPGAGIEFTKPAVFKDYAKGPGQIIFRQTGINQSIEAILGASTISGTRAYTPDELKSINANFIYPDKNSSVLIDPINQYLRARLPNNWKLALGDAKTFSNKYIKDNSYQFDLDLMEADSSGISYKGRVVYTIYGSNFYYLFVVTTSENWQKNSGTWQKTFNSIQVNR